MKLQFSLRLAMLFILLASIALAYYANYIRPIERRYLAIRQIERDSGFCVFRSSNGGILFPVNSQIPWNVRVGCIYLTGDRQRRTFPNETTLEQLKYLNDVRFVSFNSSAFADGHVKYLDDLTNLRDLQLNGTNISEIGLQHIAQRHRLKQLTLNDTSIDDRAVDALVTMKSLRTLHVYHTGLSSQGLSRLRSELPNCEISH